MSDTPAKPWGIPLSPEAKAEAISRINQRHLTLLAVGPVAFAKMGRTSVRNASRRIASAALGSHLS